jgi:hypothetical protein
MPKAAKAKAVVKMTSAPTTPRNHTMTYFTLVDALAAALARCDRHPY